MLAMHEGVDFVVDTGTPIFAAAGGVVSSQDRIRNTASLVEIDTATISPLVTRIAPDSWSKRAEVVQRGSKDRRIGSTGRATGRTWHFEVRYRGVAQESGLGFLRPRTR